MANATVAQVLFHDAAMGLLDFCFPRLCAGCGQPHAADALFCPDCDCGAGDLESAPACRRCAMPLTHPLAPCPYCRGKGLRPFDRVVRLCALRDPLKSALHAAKYRGRWPLAEQLADRLVDRQDLGSWLEGIDALVPVPLHPRRQRERGYNQSDVIARQIGRRCRRPVVAPAIRVHDTPTQTNLHSRTHRMQNLHDAFALTAPAAVEGKHLALVDDVMTTGATLTSLARALKPGQPASLSAIVLCVADPRGREFTAV